MPDTTQTLDVYKSTLTPQQVDEALRRILQIDIPSIIQKQDLFDMVYPVGSIYMSTNDVSPATFLGGTWEQLQSCFLYAESSERPAGTSGGSEFHAHTLGDSGYAYIGPQYTAEDGDCLCYKVPVKVNAFSGYKLLTNSSQRSMSGFVNATPLGGSTNSQQYLPPYLAVYMWKRTA